MAYISSNGGQQTAYDQNRVKTWADRTFGSTPYQGQQMQRNAPTFIYGKPNPVRGANIQPDIPQGQTERLRDTVNAFQADVTGMRAGAPKQAPTVAPVTPPKAPEAPQQPQQAQQPTQAPTAPEEPQQRAQAAIQTVQEQADQHPAAGTVQHQAATDQVQQDVASVANGDQTADEVMSKPWYQSNAFWKAILTQGIAIAHGADPMDALNAGMSAAQNANQSEWIINNLDKLKAQGYSDASIQTAIASGDTSQLKIKELSPQEKRQQQLEDERRSNEEWNRRSQIGQQQAIELKGIESADAQARQAASEKKAADKEAADENKATVKADREYTKDYLTGTNKFVQFNARQNAYTAKAASWWKQYEEAKAKGDMQSASKYLDFASKELENSQIVGQRSTLPEEVQAAQESGGILDKLRTHIEQVRNGTVDPDAEKALGDTIKGAGQQEKDLINNKSYNDYEMHRMNGYSPEEAAKLTNQFRSRVSEHALKPEEYEAIYQKRQKGEDTSIPQREGVLNTPAPTPKTKGVSLDDALSQVKP